jgi:hypothetical protein
MPMGRRFVLLAVLPLASLGVAGVWWGLMSEPPPASSNPAVAVAPLPIATAIVAPRPRPAPAVPAASAAPPLRDAPSDPSQFQREVQQALSSDRRGLAGPAAEHIAACLGMERMRPQLEAVMQEHQRRLLREQYAEAVADNERFFAACQSLDAASRAQLIPLLRRSLQEGGRGAAALLVSELRGFDPGREPEAVAALKRDAWACDRLSIASLNRLERRHPQLLTPDELGAIRQLQLDSAFLKPRVDQVGMAGLPEWLKAPAEADPAEVARLAALIRSQCTEDVDEAAR